MAKKYPMTPIGKKKLEEKLAYLEEKKQKEINAEVKRLRGFCDFSEDVSFKKILDEQFLVKEEISEIKEILYNSELINPKDEQSPEIMLGSRVTFIEIPGGEVETYTIVGRIDADPRENKISMESPIGKSLLGRKVDDTIFIEIPSGIIQVKVIDVS